MVELRAQIRSLESSTWYKGTAKGTESAKLAGATGTSLPTSGEKWCTGCQKSTHNTVDCYGIRRWCNGRGHKSEYCRFKKNVEAKKEEELKQPEQLKSKRRKNLNQKLLKRTGKEGPTRLPLLWTYLGQLEQQMFQILHHLKKGVQCGRQELGAKE